MFLGSASCRHREFRTVLGAFRPALHDRFLPRGEADAFGVRRLEDFMFKFSAAVILTTTLMSAQANSASISWVFTENPAEITGYPAGDAEPDYVLRVTCLRGGKVQIGIGAYDDIGAGRRGAFSVKLRSGDRSATLSGRSVRSKNSEMTGSRELRTELPLADATQFLAVLTNGRPIQASGALNETWTVVGLPEKVAAFGKSCSNN